MSSVITVVIMYVLNVTKCVSFTILSHDRYAIVSDTHHAIVIFILGVIMFDAMTVYVIC